MLVNECDKRIKGKDKQGSRSSIMKRQVKCVFIF